MSIILSNFYDLFVHMAFEFYVLSISVILLVLGVSTEKVYSKYRNRYVNYINIFDVTKACIFFLALGFIALLINSLSLLKNYGVNVTDYMTFSVFWDTLVCDPYILIVKLILTIFTIMILVLSLSFFRNEKIYSYEFPVIVVIVNFALYILISSNDFITLFLAMELQGLALYILCAIIQNKSSKVEAALKYFTIGAVGSGFFLFGCGIIYFELGSVNFVEITKLVGTVTEEQNWKILLGFISIIIAFLFKLGIAPFHTWLADVYEGAPTLVVLYMSIVPKIAIFTIFLRILKVFEEYDFVHMIAHRALFIIAIFSIIVGILGAFYQEKIRSFIAYSSIANMGYLLFLVSIAKENSIYIEFTATFYLIIYGITMMTILSIVSYLTKWSDGSKVVYLRELSGFGKSKTGIALVLSISLFSLMGIPPLAGFFSKFYIVFWLVEYNHYFSALALLLFGVLSVLYYLRVIKLLFFDKRNYMFFKPLSSTVSFYWSFLVFCQLTLWYNTDFILFISTWLQISN